MKTGDEVWGQPGDGRPQNLGQRLLGRAEPYEPWHPPVSNQQHHGPSWEQVREPRGAGWALAVMPPVMLLAEALVFAVLVLMGRGIGYPLETLIGAIFSVVGLAVVVRETKSVLLTVGWYLMRLIESYLLVLLLAVVLTSAGLVHFQVSPGTLASPEFKASATGVRAHTHHQRHHPRRDLKR
jgi:hypothetical protein